MINRNKIKVIWLLVASSLALGALAQNKTTEKVIKFDDTRHANWNSAFVEVEIPSSADTTMQKAFLYASKSATPKPLIVSLHTWSGNYTQKDPLCKEIIARDWNYIHPNFRGANKKREATGSKLVLADIQDAISYALSNTNTDPSDVHIIGVSGGGFATLAAYMNIKYPVKSFSAWAPISDLDAWYWESVGRQQKYAKDIINSVSDNGTYNQQEALLRSPLKQTLPQALRKNAKLFIYEGIHDGYTGSVPITHAINMYNRVVGELKYGTSDMNSILQQAGSDNDLVSEGEIINLVTKRINPNASARLFDRDIHTYRNYKNIELTIFEGGHEQIDQALGLIPVKTSSDLKLNILTIGDSNAAIKHGWVAQLKQCLPNSKIVNISQSGRTIGFDNNGKEKLNALRNIEGYLNEAVKKSDGNTYDYIIICLGTNDTKAVFRDRQSEVPENFAKLLDIVNRHPIAKRKTRCIFVTPPPIRRKNILEKYQGGNERLAALVPQCSAIAVKNNFEVIDVFNPLQGILDYYAEDGVHMAGPGQEIIAAKIIERLKK